TITGTPPTSTPTATATPTSLYPGAIAGTVYANSPDPANALSGAYVYACPVGGACAAHPITTDGAGHYRLSDLPVGAYYVYVKPPSYSNKLPGEIVPLSVRG